MRAHRHLVYLAKLTAVSVLFLSSAAAFGQGNAGDLYSIDADQVKIDEVKGTITYAGNARVVVANLIIEADSITIVKHNGLPAKITASGNPIMVQEQIPRKNFSGTAKQMTFLLMEFKLTLIDYSITDQTGNNMKGKKASFIFAP